MSNPELNAIYRRWWQGLKAEVPKKSKIITVIDLKAKRIQGR